MYIQGALLWENWLYFVQTKFFICLYIDLGCIFVGISVIFRANQVLHLLLCRFGVCFCGKIGYISCERTNSFAYMYIWGVFFGKVTGLRESLGTNFSIESRYKL